ncbi:MAG: FHIPEP family type III secretion protein, partial [Candidatus Eremiobacteraeota bacterium]|nr:FHIPEP family type III secretion protein [Candidatus Eremiobacteraeota bacterium]
MLGVGLFATLYNHLPPFARLLGAGHFFELSGSDRSTVLVDNLHDPASIGGLERAFSELAGHSVQVASQTGPAWWQLLPLSLSILLVYRACAWLGRHPSRLAEVPRQGGLIGAGALAVGAGSLLANHFWPLCWLVLGLTCVTLFASLDPVVRGRLLAGMALLRLLLWGALAGVAWGGPQWVTPAALAVGGVMLWLTRPADHQIDRPIHVWVQGELYALVWLALLQGPREGPLLLFLSGVAFLGLSSLLRHRRLGVSTRAGCLMRSLSRIAALVGLACLPVAWWGYHQGLAPHPLWGALPLLLLVVIGSPWRATTVREKEIVLPDSLTPLQAVAVCLMSLPPESSARLFQAMAPERVQRITLEIAKMPMIGPGLRLQVIQAVSGCCSCHAFERLAANRPELAAEMLVALMNKALQPCTARSAPGLGPVRQKHLLLGLGLVLTLVAQGGWGDLPAAGQQARAMVGYRARVLSSDHYLVVTGMGLTSRQWDELTRTLPREPGQFLVAVPLEQGPSEQFGWAVLILGLLYSLCQWFHPRPEVTGSRVAAALLGGFGLCALTGILWLPTAPFLLGFVAALAAATRVPEAVQAPPEPRPKIEVTLIRHPLPPSASPKSEPKVEPKPDRSPSERMVNLLHTDQVTLEVGRGLLSLVDPREGARLLERVQSIRATLAQEL